LFIESNNANLSVNGAAYRGTIEISNRSGTLYVINEVSMRDYLMSVVPSEIVPSWHMEALKAQAVAARTFAMFHISKGNRGIYDLYSTVSSQVYKGISVENPRTTQAVIETANVILIYGSQPIEAFFHSTCGGRTIEPKYVWSSGDIPYFRSVECNYCRDSNHYRWETTISLEQIRQALSARHSNIGRIQNITFKRKDGRVVSVIVRHANGTTNLTGNQFRMAVDPRTLKSLYFTSTPQGNGLKFSGRGWGHGVGLCQWGARGQAELGRTYEQILRHYYPNTQLHSTSMPRAGLF